MFTGAICAIVTPFKNGQVDEEKLRELIEFQIERGRMGSCHAGQRVNHLPCPMRNTIG